MQWDFDKLQMTKVIDFIYELSFSLNVERVLFCFILQDALDNCFVNSILFIYYTKITKIKQYYAISFILNMGLN